MKRAAALRHAGRQYAFYECQGRFDRASLYQVKLPVRRVVPKCGEAASQAWLSPSQQLGVLELLNYTPEIPIVYVDAVQFAKPLHRFLKRCRSEHRCNALGFGRSHGKG
jgi:hypothetical protein